MEQTGLIVGPDGKSLQYDGNRIEPKHAGPDGEQWHSLEGRGWDRQGNPTPFGAQFRMRQDGRWDVYSPERDRVWTLRNIYAVVRLIFGDVLPEYIGAVNKELERGRLTRYADLCSRANKDAVIREAYSIRRGAVAGRPFNVEPGKGPADRERLAEAAADHQRELLDRITNLEEVVMTGLDGVGIGVHVHELMWEREDARWWPQPDRVLTREVWLDGDWTPMVRDANYVFHRVEDHEGKFLVHAPQTQPGTFADQGCFQAVIWSWFYKVWSVKFWMIASERYGSPLVVGEVGTPAGAPPNQASEPARLALAADLAKLTTDSYAVTSGGSKITVYPAQGASSSALFRELCEYHDRQSLLAILGSPDLLLPAANGSRAATVARDGIRLEKTATDAKLWWASFTRDVTRHSLRYNFLGDAPLPTTTTVIDRDVQPITPLAVQAKAVTVDEVRKSLGLDEWGDERGQAIAALPEQASGFGPSPSDGGAPPAGTPPSGKPGLGGMPDLGRSPVSRAIRAGA